MIYYWESKNRSGNFAAKNDDIAFKRSEKIKGLVILYRENSDTSDGLPFIVLIEEKKDA